MKTAQATAECRVCNLKLYVPLSIEEYTAYQSRCESMQVERLSSCELKLNQDSEKSCD